MTVSTSKGRESVSSRDDTSRAETSVESTSKASVFSLHKDRHWLLHDVDFGDDDWHGFVDCNWEWLWDVDGDLHEHWHLVWDADWNWNLLHHLDRVRLVHVDWVWLDDMHWVGLVDFDGYGNLDCVVHLLFDGDWEWVGHWHGDLLVDGDVVDVAVVAGAHLVSETGEA